MDNLRKICGRQHGSDWYNAQRGDPEKAKYLIEHFRNHKKAVEIGDVSEKWAVAMAKTELATETETEISDRGRLMDKSEYIEWMTHEKPGTKKTAAEAISTFDGWLKELRAGTGQHPPSQKNVEKEEMFRVHVVWDMDYHTMMRVKKAVEIPNETKKKPDEDWFASKRASLMNNLDTFGGNDLDMEGMGTSLLGGCVGLDASIGDIRKMGAPEVKQEEEEGGENEEEEEEGGSDGEPKKKKAKKETADSPAKFQNPSTLLAEQRWSEKFVKEYKEGVQAKIKLLEDWFVFVNAIPVNSPHATYFDVEKTLAQTRLTALRVCIDGTGSEAKLKELIQSYTATSSSSSNGSAPPTQHCLGKSPPCEDYLHLKSLAVVEAAASKIVECLSKEDSKDYRK